MNAPVVRTSPTLPFEMEALGGTRITREEVELIASDHGADLRACPATGTLADRDGHTIAEPGQDGRFDLPTILRWIGY